MPTIQQENGRKSVAGLPPRWGVRAYQELNNAQSGKVSGMPERYKELSKILDEVIDAPIPIDATDAHLCVIAERYAQECERQAARIHDLGALRQRLASICAMRGIDAPDVNEDKQFIYRCSDPAWWRRNLRKVHGRKFEHAAIRLGFVSIRAGAYASDETVLRRIAQNRRNAKSLQSITMENEDGQSFLLSELAVKGTGNKTIRRGELMLRIAGCEEVAIESNHVGVFVTLTCPSKYHAILAKSGTVNPNYNNSTPNQAQEHLQDVWKRTRAKNGRDGVRPYGFRIAEPHHDGCPHWHMLVFMAPDKVAQFQDNLTRYALEEDGDEPGAKTNRIKFVSIDPAKGTAAGYIAKYIGKNIDDEHVDEHIDEDGVINTDLVGDQIIKPSQRVEAWAAVWGIRQFQPIGMPPVIVWRELRRVENERIRKAPSYIREAWEACQKIEGQKAANFAPYIRAQGGINVGRNYRIGVATRQAEVEGRYGLSERAVNVGIYAKNQPNAIYESTRYRWKRSGVAVAVGFRFSWTGVNNCTPPAWTEYIKEQEPMQKFNDDEYWSTFDDSYLRSKEYQDWEKGNLHA